MSKRRYQPAYQCPFFLRRRTRGFYCEGGELLFPNETASHDHIISFCANECAWAHCSIAKTLQRYYDRKEEGYGKSSKDS